MRRFGITGFVTGLPARLTNFASLAIAATILIPTAGTFADDTIARLGAGGITFTKSEHIRMLEEVLEISEKIVRVRFRFLNESDQNIHTTVAFPLPLYGYRPASVDGPPAEPHPGHIMATFKVSVNGRLVSTEFARKAVVDERDVTAQLRELGLSDEQIFNYVDLTEDQQAAWEKLDDSKKELLKDWKVAETAFWQQDFPAGKDILIEHSYEPEVGGFYGVREIPRYRSEDNTDEVCLDEATKRAIENQFKGHAPEGTEMVYVSVQDIEYILATGRNWKGPIGEFTLRIKKKPDEFVSLCFPGKPKKISPTVYEFHEKDFVPPDKLVVYFYSVGPEVSQ